jgi:hypothetical protein
MLASTAHGSAPCLHRRREELMPGRHVRRANSRAAAEDVSVADPTSPPLTYDATMRCAGHLHFWV